jgi:hypothetical protein
VIVRQPKEVFATSAARKTTPTNNVPNNSTHLLIVSIVARKDTLQEIAQQMRRDYIKKEVPALDVDQ